MKRRPQFGKASQYIQAPVFSAYEAVGSLLRAGFVLRPLGCLYPSRRSCRVRDRWQRCALVASSPESSAALFRQPPSPCSIPSLYAWAPAFSARSAVDRTLPSRAA